MTTATNRELETINRKLGTIDRKLETIDLKQLAVSKQQAVTAGKTDDGETVFLLPGKTKGAVTTDRKSHQTKNSIKQKTIGTGKHFRPDTNSLAYNNLHKVLFQYSSVTESYSIIYHYYNIQDNRYPTPGDIHFVYFNK